MKYIIFHILMIIVLSASVVIAAKSMPQPARGVELGEIARGHLTRFETPSAVCFVYQYGGGESLSCIPNR